MLFHLLKKKIINFIIVRQGGEPTSELLRKITERDHSVNVDMFSYGGCFAPSFNLGGKVIVGRYTSIGSNVQYFGANHPVNYFSTSPYFYRQHWAKKLGGGVTVEDVERYCLTIGNDVWIGAGVKITCGCHFIGNGAVVGTGSIVTKDIPPYSIVAGNPARIIKKRFTDEQAGKLEESKWFEFTPDILLRFYEYHADPILFAEKVLEYRQKNVRL